MSSDNVGATLTTAGAATGNPALAAAGIGLQALGSLTSAYSANKQNKRNIRFQREMAKNAVRYRYADLKAAGLNPILAAGGQAAVASGGSSVSPQNPFEGIASSALQYNINKQMARKIHNEADMTGFKARVEQLKLKALEGAIDKFSSLSAEDLIPAFGTALGFGKAMNFMNNIYSVDSKGKRKGNTSSKGPLKIKITDFLRSK